MDELFSFFSKFNLIYVLINFFIFLAGYGGFKLLQKTTNGEIEKHKEHFHPPWYKIIYWLFLVPVTTAFSLLVFGNIFNIHDLVNFVIAGTVFVWIYYFFKVQIRDKD